jgi:hypothetical protein
MHHEQQLHDWPRGYSLKGVGSGVFHQDDSLISDSLKLTRGINEPFLDMVRKLENGKKVACTIAKTHRGVEQVSRLLDSSE